MYQKQGQPKISYSIKVKTEIFTVNFIMTDMITLR